MPSTADAPPQRRPGLPHRHSSGSASFAKSPADHQQLSSSTSHRPRGSRGALGPPQRTARNPSFSKNMNKLGRLTPANDTTVTVEQTSPRRGTGHVKHNSSIVHFEEPPLRKNQSETSLKKNKSSGHLGKLPRASSSRNVASKATKVRHRRSRTSSGNITGLPPGPANPTVRFDLGREDDDDDEVDEDEDVDPDDPDAGEGSWANTDSRSPSTTRSSTRRSSLSGAALPHRPGSNGVEARERPASAQEDDEATALPKSKSLSAMASMASASSPRRPDILSRLLQRNPSFTAAPQVNSQAATPIMVDPHTPVAQSHNTLNDSSNPEVVSRFLAQSSTSGPSHQSSFFPRTVTPASTTPGSQGSNDPSSPEKASKISKGEDEQSQRQNAEDDAPRRNKSLPNFGDERVSRTQQRLNLERESVTTGSQPSFTTTPRTLLHVSRLSSATLPYAAAAVGAATNGNAGGPNTPSSQTLARQLCARAAVEHRRIRLYQAPLAAAASRALVGFRHAEAKRARRALRRSERDDRRDARRDAGYGSDCDSTHTLRSDDEHVADPDSEAASRSRARERARRRPGSSSVSVNDSGAVTPDRSRPGTAASERERDGHLAPPQGKKLTSSVRSGRSGRSVEITGPAAAAAPSTPRRPRVMFQGLKDDSPEHDEANGLNSPRMYDKRGILDGAVDERRGDAERARELCAKLWARRKIVAGD